MKTGKMILAFAYLRLSREEMQALLDALDEEGQ